MGNQNCLSLSTKQEDDIVSKALIHQNQDMPDPLYTKQIGDDLTNLPCNVNHIRTQFLNQKLEPYEPFQKGNFNKDSFYQIEGYNLYYSGDWKKGIPHGQGQAILKDGSYFKGFFKYGKAYGRKCLFVSKNGAHYTGSIINNLRNGFGRLIHNKYVYQGEWATNLPQGYGVQTFQNGDKYKGQFVKGNKQGKGVYEWNIGEYKSYNGNFIDNFISGQGMLQKRDGTRINGNFNSKDDFQLDIQNCQIQSKQYKLSGNFHQGKLQGRYQYRDKMKNKTYRLSKNDFSKITGEVIENEKKYKIFKNKKLIHFNANFDERALDIMLYGIQKGYMHAKKHSQALKDIQEQFSDYEFKWWQMNNKIEGIAIVPICGRYILIQQKQDR